MKLDQFGETKSSTAGASTSGWPRKLSKFQGASLVFGVLTAIALLAIGVGAGDLVSRDEFERWERHKKLSYLEAIKGRDHEVASLVLALVDTDLEVSRTGYRRLLAIQNRWILDDPLERTQKNRSLIEMVVKEATSLDARQRLLSSDLIRQGIGSMDHKNLNDQERIRSYSHWALEAISGETILDSGDQLLGSKSKGEQSSTIQSDRRASHRQLFSKMGWDAVTAPYVPLPLEDEARGDDDHGVFFAEHSVATVSDKTDSDIALKALPFGSQPTLRPIELEGSVARSQPNPKRDPAEVDSWQDARDQVDLVNFQVNAGVPARPPKTLTVDLTPALRELPEASSRLEGMDARLGHREAEADSTASGHERVLSKHGDWEVIQWLGSDHEGFQKLAVEELSHRALTPSTILLAKRFVTQDLGSQLQIVNWVANSQEGEPKFWAPFFFKMKSREFKLASVEILARSPRQCVQQWLFDHAKKESDAVVVQRIHTSMAVEELRSP